jgi:hypothetical protein
VSPDGLRPRLEVDGVGMTASSSGPLRGSIGRRVGVSGSSGDGMPTFAQRQTRTGMRRVIVHSAAGLLGCAPVLAGPGRSLVAGSFGLRSYPRQVTDDDAIYLHILLR